MSVDYRELLPYGLRIEPEHFGALGMAFVYHPLSITPEEFAWLRDHVAARGYASAYECATAFGVSACAIGLGLKQTGGALVSMDAYIEEQHHHAAAYDGHGRAVYADGPGYEIARRLRAHFELDDVVTFVRGWSPDDVDLALGERTLDFAFIDAGHFDRNLLADVKAILPRLRRPYSVVLHDCGAFKPETLLMVEGMLGGELRRVPFERSFQMRWAEVGA